MVTYAQLLEMDTTRLTSAAQASGEFASTMAQRGDEVRASADISSYMWMGLDANAASDLLSQLPVPLYDVSDSATSGMRELDKLATAINDAKGKLLDAKIAADRAGLTINPDGSVTTPKGVPKEQALIDAENARQIATTVSTAVNDANTADDEATRKLEALAGTVAAGYTSIPSKEADEREALRILRTPADQITPETAQRLNDILQRHADDPLFNQHLMRELGPQRLIEDSARFSEAGARLAESGDTAGADAFRETQRLLGETLASASQAPGGLGQEFTQGLMDQAAKPLAEDPIHNGYRALAPLFEHGQYDRSFLVPIAEHMTRLDAAVPGVGIQNPYNPGSLPSLDNPYVIDGDRSGPNNPLNAVMGALDRSPDAAADYFNGNNSEHGTYRDANGIEIPAVKGDGANPNIDYALDHAGKSNDGYSLDVDRVGGALEAAATGVQSEADVDELPTRTKEMATVAEHLVHRFGGGFDDTVDIRPGGKLEGMVDNLTDVAATYMVDIQNSMLHPDDSEFALDAPGADADFDRTEASYFVHGLGQHQDSADTLMGASDATRAAMVAQAHELNSDQQDWVQNATKPGSAVNLVLSDAAGDAVVQDYRDADAGRNTAVDLVGRGAKIATAALTANPVYGATIGEAIDLLKGSFQSDTSSQATFEAAQVAAGFSEANRTAATDALEAALSADGPLTEAERLFIDGQGGQIDDGRNTAFTELPEDLRENPEK